MIPFPIAFLFTSQESFHLKHNLANCHQIHVLRAASVQHLSITKSHSPEASFASLAHSDTPRLNKIFLSHSTKKILEILYKKIRI